MVGLEERMGRDNVISILKGIGILLVVVGHSGCPQIISRWIYCFHMPLFFMASGYFFSDKYIDDPWTFFRKKVNGIYWPFVKWSIAFLLLHDIFMYLGIMNTGYGSAHGDCPSWFSSMDILRNSVDVVTKMTSYDYFICGAFWFFRALFVGNVLLCICSWFVKKYLHVSRSVLFVTLVFGILGGLKVIWGKDIPNWPQGGYRELMAVFFIGIGYLTKSFVVDNAGKWYGIFIACLLLVISALWLPTDMGYRGQTLVKWITLCITGLAGFFFVYGISRFVDGKKNQIRTILMFLGENSIYVLIFHFLFFKPASYLKIMIWHLDVKMISCHPVIPENNDWYWLVYSLTSVLLCVGAVLMQKKLQIQQKIKSVFRLTVNE